MYEFFVPIFFFHTIKRTKTFIKNSIEFVREIFFFLPLFKTLLNASSHLLEYTWVAYGLEGNPPCIDFLLGRTRTRTRVHTTG